MEPIALGGDLSVSTLLEAYRHGVFPWYNEGQSILWWCPDPRMVLATQQFRLHRSLRKNLQQLLRDQRLSVRIDSDFSRVIQACANTSRARQDGTWIVPEMQAAYTALHQAGYAHSVETWIDSELQGGLYCVAIGAAVFGESMFSWQSNASKFALAALVSLCLREGVAWIDCQQDTAHLHSLGARAIPRERFLRQVYVWRDAPALNWHFHSDGIIEHSDWQPVLSLRP